jgi:hypothetical protein
MKTVISGVVIALCLGSAAQAADLFGAPNSCSVVTHSDLLSIADNSELTTEVVRYMTEAVNVADSSEWTDSRSSAFTWASEAKVACGIAFGYLQYDHRDDDHINKCECFHSRMVDYM